MTASPEGFPPQDLRSFLELCAGEWLALRSHFDLSLVEPGDPEGDPGMQPVASQGSPEAGHQNEPEAQATEPQAVEPPAGDGLPDLEALLAAARAEQSGAAVASIDAAIEEAWHSSERGELQVTYLAPERSDQPGGLQVRAPGGSASALQFHNDGSFRAEGEGSGGRWQLWPDGSLELQQEHPQGELRERIWFTQPNLRLRSSIARDRDGRPGQARFSSEIRRLRKPTA